MKITIVGCGKIGTAIMKSLLKERHDIIVIDSNEEIVNNIVNKYDVIGICGNATSYDLLRQANTDKCDLFIAMTGSDEYNMLSSFIAKKMGAKHTIARIRDSKYSTPDFDFIKNHLGISMTINPEYMTAQVLYNILKLPSAISVETFSSGGFELIELNVKKDQKIIGVPLFEVRKSLPINFLICAVQRGEEVFIPNGLSVLQEGDKIGIIVSYDDAHKLLKLIGTEQILIKDVMIVGASKIAYYLTKFLLSGKNSVTVIEKDKTACEKFVEHIGGGVNVVYGNGLNKDLLLENGLSNSDAFVALTGKDADNVLMSVSALDKQSLKVITKINSEELIANAEKMGVECVVSAKNVVEDAVNKYVKALKDTIGSKIETLYSLMNGTIEAIEFLVTSDFKYAGVPLKDLTFKSNAIIAGIIRNSENIIPNGEDVILANDKVIIITSNNKVLELSEIIRKK